MSIIHESEDAVGYICKSCHIVFEGSTQIAYKFRIPEFETPGGDYQSDSNDGTFWSDSETLYGDEVWLCHDDPPCSADSRSELEVAFSLSSFSCSICGWNLHLMDENRLRSQFRDQGSDYEDWESEVKDFLTDNFTYLTSEEEARTFAGQHVALYHSEYEPPSVTSTIKEVRI